MKEIRFLGPTHILEIDGQTVPRGASIHVSEKTAERLKKSPQVQVEVRNLSSPRVASTPRASRSRGVAPKGIKGSAFAGSKAKEEES